MKNTYNRVVIITIALIILNQCFIQFWLFQKRADASIINLSGRQRMLSQRLLNLTRAHQDNPEIVSIEEINKTFKLWESSHESIMEQVEKDVIDKLSGLDVRKDLLQLNPFIEVARAKVANPMSLSKADFETFRNNQDAFLFSMNEIVNKLENESNKKLIIVVVTELLFAFFSLLMVYYEIIFVFRKINKNLARQNDELEESNQLLEQYAYLAAHNLKSPSQNLLNFATLLQSKVSAKIDLKEKTYLDYIIQSARKLLETTSDLLRFASFSQQALTIQSVVPERLIKRVLKNLAPLIEAKKAKIEIGALPEMIEADEELLFEVFQNIIDNALKFVVLNQPLYIKIAYISTKDNHQFSISDNGIGIAEEYRTAIFRVLNRLNSEKDYQGTGIGLAICQKNIAKHNGRIWVEGKVGKGCNFLFTIPKKIVL